MPHAVTTRESHAPQPRNGHPRTKEGPLSPKDLEFQMLYGIRKQEQLRLAAQGYRFRVLISYGAAWFPWYMRRLAERPANVLFVMKGLFAR